MEFFNFRCKYSDYAYYQNFYGATQLSRRVKISCSQQQQARVAVRESEGTLMPSTAYQQSTVLELHRWEKM
jgi:hypothetical protein